MVRTFGGLKWWHWIVVLLWGGIVFVQSAPHPGIIRFATALILALTIPYVVILGVVRAVVWLGSSGADDDASADV